MKYRFKHILPLLFLCLMVPVNLMAQNDPKNKKVGMIEQERVVPKVEEPSYLPELKPEPKPKPKPKPKAKPEPEPKPEPKPKPSPYSDFFPSTCFYIQPALQVGSLMGLGISAGAYISNFNVEAFFTMGLAKSEDITWYPPTGSGKDNVTCSYKPTVFGLRIGYGFIVAEKLRLTPQVGLAAVGIKCSDGDSKGNAGSATIGLKGEYALSRNIALFVSPEVAFAASKSDVFKQLEDVSSKIKGWGTGFNARLGVTVSF